MTSVEREESRVGVLTRTGEETRGKPRKCPRRKRWHTSQSKRFASARAWTPALRGVRALIRSSSAVFSARAAAYQDGVLGRVLGPRPSAFLRSLGPSDFGPPPAPHAHVSRLTLQACLALCRTQ